MKQKSSPKVRRKKPIANASFRFHAKDIEWFRKESGTRKGANADLFRDMKEAYMEANKRNRAADNGGAR